MAGNNKSDTPRWVSMDSVMDAIQQEIGLIGEQRIQLAYLDEMEEMDGRSGCNEMTRIATLHLESKQKALGNIQKRIKKLPYER